MIKWITCRNVQNEVYSWCQPCLNFLLADLSFLVFFLRLMKIHHWPHRRNKQDSNLTPTQISPQRDSNFNPRSPFLTYYSLPLFFYKTFFCCCLLLTLLFLSLYLPMEISERDWKTDWPSSPRTLVQPDQMNFAEGQEKVTGGSSDWRKVSYWGMIIETCVDNLWMCMDYSDYQQIPLWFYAFHFLLLKLSTNCFIFAVIYSAHIFSVRTWSC